MAPRNDHSQPEHILAKVEDAMTFGKRTAQPALLEPDDNCPHCRGAGAIRGRGQRKVCLACKGTGKRAPAPSAPAETSEPVTVDTPAQPAEAAACDT